MGEELQGWQGFPSAGWQSANAVRRRLDAGADPDGGIFGHAPLHLAVEHGSAEAVAELAARAQHVDAVNRGRTPLWRAVQEGKPDIAQVLLAAGADPARPLMSGWSPARLSLATAHPLPTDEALTGQEQALVDGRAGLLGALRPFPDYHGHSIACVAGIDGAEAVRRLGASVVLAADVPPDVPVGDWYPAPFGEQTDFAACVTDVPGGCILVQPWHFNVQTPEVLGPLSEGTVAYGMYNNPKSGNQGYVYRDGKGVAGDLHPGGGPDEYQGTYDVLLAHLYEHNAVAHCCAHAGLRPTDLKAFTEPDQWILLPALSDGRA